eukprot:UN10490
MSGWDCNSCALRNNYTRISYSYHTRLPINVIALLQGQIIITKLNFNLNKNTIKNCIDYQNWTSTQVIDWIVTAEKGKFKEYQSALKYSFAEEDIDGSCLDDIDQTDVEMWGIKQQDQKGIFGVIQSLLQLNIN